KKGMADQTFDIEIFLNGCSHTRESRNENDGQVVNNNDSHIYDLLEPKIDIYNSRNVNGGQVFKPTTSSEDEVKMIQTDETRDEIEEKKKDKEKVVGLAYGWINPWLSAYY
ncbi:10161_t:CDS:1, partial [Racocetra persica]